MELIQKYLTKNPYWRNDNGVGEGEQEGIDNG